MEWIKTEDNGRGGEVVYEFDLVDSDGLLARRIYGVIISRPSGSGITYAEISVLTTGFTDDNFGYRMAKSFRGNNALRNAKRWVSRMYRHYPDYISDIKVSCE